MPTPAPLRIGVIGCGYVAQGHFQAIATSQRWTLTAVADLDASRVHRAQHDYHAPVGHTDWRKLLDTPDLDAVIVATHADTHAPITVAALDRGLHVLCEKPMATDLESCQRMIDAARRNNRLLAINFNARSTPVYREMKRIIDAGEIGRVLAVRFVYTWSAHHWQPTERMDNFMRNGGPVIDSAVHFFECARWFTGRDFTRIEASGVTLPPYDNPQHVVAACQLDDGSTATIEVSWLYTKNTRDEGYFFNITAIGEHGTLDFTSDSNRIKIWTQNDTRQLPCGDLEKHFGVVLDKLADSIAAGRLIDLASGDDGLKATAAAYTALASAKRR